MDGAIKAVNRAKGQLFEDEGLTTFDEENTSDTQEIESTTHKYMIKLTSNTSNDMTTWKAVFRKISKQ
ncbi:hypothetical protein FBU31_002219, partial [Coemansia sp. 'formosensis']